MVSIRLTVGLTALSRRKRGWRMANREWRIANRGRSPIRYSPLAIRRSLLPVLLDARGAQAGEAVAVDRVLPGEEFLNRQRVAAAGLLEREQATAHGGDDLGRAREGPQSSTDCRRVR